MNVLVVTNMYPAPGRLNSGVFVRTQVESLERLGVTTDVHVIEGWRGAAHYARAFRDLPRLVRGRRPDLVHAHYGLTGAAAIRVDAPLVVSFCGDDVLGSTGRTGRITRRSRILARLSHIAARRADAIVVKSEEMRARLRADMEVDVIPNGVDLDLFAPLPLHEARRRLGWSETGRVVLFAASPEYRVKNWPLARDVVDMLRTRGHDVRLEAFFGRPQADLVAAMSAADVLLLPSYHEGSPNVVKEAMAVGLPVVAAPVGDCVERLEGCHPSAIAELDVMAFTTAVEHVLDTGGRSNGREMVASLALDVVARRILDVYERVASGRTAEIATAHRASG